MYKDRIALYQQIEQARKSRLLVCVTGDRPQLETHINQDFVNLFTRHLDLIGDVEHISLFSQFLIIMAFNKYRAAFKGVSNIVEATSKEEQIHGMFGVELVRLLQQENPEWFNAETEEVVLQAVERAYAAEQRILDWIFERGELEYLTYAQVDAFLRNRFNNSLRNVGIRPAFTVDETALAATRWFDEELLATKENDFFNKRSITYSKKMKSFSEDALF